LLLLGSSLRAGVAATTAVLTGFLGFQETGAGLVAERDPPPETAGTCRHEFRGFATVHFTTFNVAGFGVENVGSAWETAGSVHVAAVTKRPTIQRLARMGTLPPSRQGFFSA
jgi:hypothetical protein